MAEESQNALLKTLEEPPSYAHLILITSEPASLLDTVRSRCQDVRFAALSPERVAARLAAELPGADAATIKALAGLGGDLGSARVLGSPTGARLRDHAERCARAALAGGARAAAVGGPARHRGRARQAAGGHDRRGRRRARRRDRQGPRRGPDPPGGRERRPSGPSGAAAPRRSTWPSGWSPTGSPTSSRSPRAPPTWSAAPIASRRSARTRAAPIRSRRGGAPSWRWRRVGACRSTSTRSWRWMLSSTGRPGCLANGERVR